MGVTVKVYGIGWVGKAVQTLFPDAIVHDPPQGFMDSRKADVAFVCVPTPNLEDGSLDMSFVEEVVKNSMEDLIVIRSTLQPGTCDRLEKEYGKNICFVPEYLGETVAHPLLDETERKFLIIGGKPENRRKLIELYQSVYNANITIRQVTNLEAEVIKLSENRAISFKVALCQEMFDVCELQGIDYYTVRDAVLGDDPRFNLWWSFVYPSRRGMESKCIPKDVYGWASWARSLGYEPKVTQSILDKNKEWLALNG